MKDLVQGLQHVWMESLHGILVMTNSTYEDKADMKRLLIKIMVKLHMMALKLPFDRLPLFFFLHSVIIDFFNDLILVFLVIKDHSWLVQLAWTVTTRT